MNSTRAARPRSKWPNTNGISKPCAAPRISRGRARGASAPRPSRSGRRRPRRRHAVIARRELVGAARLPCDALVARRPLVALGVAEVGEDRPAPHVLGVHRQEELHLVAVRAEHRRHGVPAARAARRRSIGSRGRKHGAVAEEARQLDHARERVVGVRREELARGQRAEPRRRRRPAPSRRRPASRSRGPARGPAPAAASARSRASSAGGPARRRRCSSPPRRAPGVAFRRSARWRGGRGRAARGERSSIATFVPPADSPKIVTLPGSPPNAATFSCTHASARTRSSVP